jgi:hypothetical protein
LETEDLDTKLCDLMASSRKSHKKRKNRKYVIIYTIFEAPVSMVVTRHLFINNSSQLFQINLLHVYIWPNDSPAWARRSRATTLAHARHAGLLTVTD